MLIHHHCLKSATLALTFVVMSAPPVGAQQGQSEITQVGQLLDRIFNCIAVDKGKGLEFLHLYVDASARTYQMDNVERQALTAAASALAQIYIELRPSRDTLVLRGLTDDQLAIALAALNEEKRRRISTVAATLTLQFRPTTLLRLGRRE